MLASAGVWREVEQSRRGVLACGGGQRRRGVRAAARVGTEGVRVKDKIAGPVGVLWRGRGD